MTSCDLSIRVPSGMVKAKGFPLFVVPRMVPPCRRMLLLHTPMSSSSNSTGRRSNPMVPWRMP